MILDFDKLELRYCVNGKDYGKAWDIDKGKKYRGYAAIFREGIVELL